jgi:hypothetical protein
MPELDPKTIEDLKAKHGRVYQLTVPLGDDEPRVFVFRAPKKPEYKRYRKEMFDEETRDVATEHLVRDVIVHPDKAGFNALLEEYPALAETIGKDVQRVMGAVKTDEGKAL